MESAWWQLTATAEADTTSSTISQLPLSVREEATIIVDDDLAIISQDAQCRPKSSSPVPSAPCGYADSGVDS